MTDPKIGYKWLKTDANETLRWAGFKISYVTSEMTVWTLEQTKVLVHDSGCRWFREGTENFTDIYTIAQLKVFIGDNEKDSK